MRVTARPLLIALLASCGGLPAQNKEVPSEKSSKTGIADAGNQRGAAGATGLNVPLVFQEGLVGDAHNRTSFQLVQGQDRTSAPVRVGIPLPRDGNITSETQLGLAGASVGQFRAVSRWDNGNIQWVIVDTQVDVTTGRRTGGIALVDGNGNFGGTDLAADKGDTILVQTDSAIFSVKKIGFNLFDRVQVGSTEIVSPGASPGVVLTGNDGTSFLASLDSNIQVSIEENGPVHAVLVAKGTHRSTAGARNLDFTVRMHFRKGSAAAQVVYQLRNASKEQYTNQPFRSLELVVKAHMTQPQAVFSLPVAELPPMTLASSDTLSLFAGRNNFYTNVQTWNNDIFWPTGVSGYSVKQNGRPLIPLVSGDATNFIDLFYGQIRDESGNSLMIGTRFAAGYFPQGLQIEGNGTVRVGLYPADNDRTYYSRFMGYETRQALFDFTPSATARTQFFNYQYPVVGKVQSRDWYNRTGVISERLTAPSNEYAYNVANNWATPGQTTSDCVPNNPFSCDLPQTLRPTFLVYRAKDYRAGGGANQYDAGKKALLDFLREDAIFAGGYFVDGAEKILYGTDRAILHADDFNVLVGDPGSHIPGYNGNTPAFQTAANSQYVNSYGATLDWEHPHFYGASLLYHLTGDEGIRESYLQFGNLLKMFNVNQYYWRQTRPLAWAIYLLTDMFQFTGDRSYRDLAYQAIKTQFLDTDASYPTRAGFNWQRGYFSPRDDEWSMAPFMIGAMMPRALTYFLEKGDPSEVEGDRTRDVLEGVVRYVVNELFFEFPNHRGELTYGNFGYPYRYRIGDRLCIGDPLPSERACDQRRMGDWYFGIREAYPPFYLGYQLTHDMEYLRKGKLLMMGVAVGSQNNTWLLNFPEYSRLYDALANTQTYNYWMRVPIHATAMGTGVYRISWTVPQGAQQYWIKYASKPIVDWLNYEKFSASFGIDPDNNVPFFAAQNVAAKPAPGPVGSTQSMTVTIPNATGTYYFDMKVLIGP